MSDERDSPIQPDYQVIVYKGNMQLGICGLFFGDGDEVDCGLGICSDDEPQLLALVLSLAGKAFADATSWYGKDGMDNYPSVAEKIKRGEWS